MSSLSKYDLVGLHYSKLITMNSLGCYELTCRLQELFIKVTH